jgi:hypothetical protein
MEAWLALFTYPPSVLAYTVAFGVSMGKPPLASPESQEWVFHHRGVPFLEEGKES